MSPFAKDYLSQQMSEQDYLDSEPYSEFKRESKMRIWWSGWPKKP